MTNRTAISRAALTLAVAALAAAAAACSSSSKKPAPTAPPAVTAAPAAPTATVGPDARTATALGPAAGLVAYREPQGRYTMRAPAGWTKVEQTDLTSFSLPQAPLTTIGIFCQPGLTSAQLQAQDNGVISGIARRTINSTGVVPTGAGPATVIQSQTTLSSNLLLNETYYLEGKGCAWRIQLTTILAQQFNQYSDLLTKIMASFQFTPGA